MTNYKTASLFLCLSIIFSSCYFFPSGSPQPTDFLGIFAFLILIFNFKNRKAITNSFLQKQTLVYFIIVFSASNIFSLRFFPEVTLLGSLLGIAYVLFNVAIYLSFNFVCFQKANLHNLSWFVNSCLLCSLIDFISVFINTKVRGQGFMNNPNQFGAHVLCLLLISILVSKKNLLSWKLILIFLLLITPALQSGSKSALLAGLPIIFIFFQSFLKNISKSFSLFFVFLKSKIIYLIILLIIISLLLYIFPEIINTLSLRFSHSLDFTSERFADAQEEGDTDLWYGRNVYLITKLTLLDWLIGVGYFQYYKRLGESFEIHSLFPSLIVIGGLFSCFFFLLFFFLRLKKNVDFSPWLAIFSLILYSISHQFFRDSGMWIVLGLMR
jgi:hypothetical protein